MWNTDELKRLDIQGAKADLTKLEAIKILLTNNQLAAEIHVSRLVVGISLNSRLLPVVEAEILEVNKYLAGEPNTYE